MKLSSSRTTRQRVLFATLLYWIAFLGWTNMSDGVLKDLLLVLLFISSMVLFAIAIVVGFAKKKSARYKEERK